MAMVDVDVHFADSHWSWLAWSRVGGHQCNFCYEN